MKKILSTLILLAILVLPMMVAAQFEVPPTTPEEYLDPIEALGVIVDWLFYILLIFAALMIVVAGFYFITATGDPEKTKTARNFVLWAIIGIIIGFLAKGIVWFIGRMMGTPVSW